MFKALQLVSSRAALVAKPQTRALSSQGNDAVQKLRSVLEDYRQSNYTQELPGRFKKEIVKAASENQTSVGMNGMQQVLANIGASHVISPSEMQVIFAELGNGSQISAQRMVQII